MQSLGLEIDAEGIGATGSSRKVYMIIMSWQTQEKWRGGQLAYDTLAERIGGAAITRIR